MAKTTVTKVKAAKTATEVKTIDQLKADLVAAQGELALSRRSFMQGELVNPKVMGVQRKSIARLLTAINKSEKESK